MIENDYFTVTLPSDNFNINFEENTMSNYITELKDVIDLKREYEVGVVEMIYPTSIENIPFDVNVHLMYSSPNGVFTLISKTINNGNYNSEEKVLKTINDKMMSITNEDIENSLKDKLGKEIKCEIKNRPEINMINNFIELTHGKIKVFHKVKSEVNVIYWDFDDYLLQMLGFKPNQLMLSAKIKAKYPIDIYGSIHTLYIYSNIVKSSYVGGNKAQLLRIVALENPSKNIVGSMKCATFNPIMYFPLRQRRFNSIEIQIRDSTGKLINFQSGKVILTLMFRPLEYH